MDRRFAVDRERASYTAWDFARRAAKSFGGEVRYVVITSS